MNEQEQFENKSNINEFFSKHKKRAIVIKLTTKHDKENFLFFLTNEEKDILTNYIKNNNINDIESYLQSNNNFQEYPLWFGDIIEINYRSKEKRRPQKMKKPLPHQYLSQYMTNYETEGLIKYYEALIIYREKEINEIKELIIALKKTLY